MKKWLLLVAVCLTLTSCKWIHETFYSVEGCAEWYASEIWDAVEDDDVDAFIEAGNDYEAWYKSLGSADQKTAEKAAEAWSKKNANEEKFFEFIEKHAEEINKRLN